MEVEAFLAQVQENVKYLPKNSTNILDGWSHDDNAMAKNVRIFFEDALPNIIKLNRIGRTVVFNFKLQDKEIVYGYSDLKECIEANYNLKSNEPKIVVQHIQNFVNCYLYSDESDFETFFASDDKTPTENYPVLERFADVVNDQNEKDSFLFCLLYPFINSKQGLRKHLMFGFRSNSGKSVMTGALNSLYRESSIMKEIRSKSPFDAGNWNSDVIDKFVTIIDDDGDSDSRDRKIDEDFIKNFMNPQMPLPLARSQKRESKVYNGSCVIAINNKPEPLYIEQNNKRVVFVVLETNVVKLFDEEEHNYLHNIPRCDLLHYIEIHDMASTAHYWYHKRDNKYPYTDLELQKLQLEKDMKKYVAYRGRVDSKEMYSIFDRKDVTAILGTPRLLIDKQSNGRPTYGWVAEKARLVLGDQQDGRLLANFYESVTTAHQGKQAQVSQPALIKGILEDGAKAEEIGLALGDTGKKNGYYKDGEAMRMYGLYELKDPDGSATLTNLKRSTGLVIDVDNSNYRSLDEVIVKLYLTNYKGFVYETVSSTEGKLRYRIVIPNIFIEDPEVYKKRCRELVAYIGDNIDDTSNTIVHRYFMAGSNVMLFGNVVKDEEAIIASVKNCPKGEGKRHMNLVWAINRAHDDDNAELAQRICEASSLPQSEINAVYRSIFRD